MNDQIRQLIQLQNIDALILQKAAFMSKVPLRINERDEPLKAAAADLDSIKRKNDALAAKKRDREKSIEDVNEKIRKMKSRTDLKSNKEYQAHLKEIEAAGKEISSMEEDILVIMEELDRALKIQKEKESGVAAETEKLNAFKAELDAETQKIKVELSDLRKQRESIAASVPADVYKRYMKLLEAGGGVALAKTASEVCMGCNMNIPPQLFVEIRKGEELLSCPQCRRILYFDEDSDGSTV